MTPSLLSHPFLHLGINSIQITNYFQFPLFAPSLVRLILRRARRSAAKIHAPALFNRPSTIPDCSGSTRHSKESRVSNGFERLARDEPLGAQIYNKANDCYKTRINSHAKQDFNAVPFHDCLTFHYSQPFPNRCLRYID